MVFNHPCENNICLKEKQLFIDLKIQIRLLYLMKKSTLTEKHKRCQNCIILNGNSHNTDVNNRPVRAVWQWISMKKDTGWEREEDNISCKEDHKFLLPFFPDPKWLLHCVVWLEFFTTFPRAIHWKLTALYFAISIIIVNTCRLNLSFPGFNIFGQLFSHCRTSSN